ncbi:CACTA en-spm transposon protein [Cucumis melo var. makuwa]|uniref:CACTA en-spm transposon protein n=1 Tax=Cucumis melo var. makuwa TaxID=1194695 RepID=A0A5D3CPC6_CUCMM|nr:CACTA en-spm transposon protein [Cucumis melo var. makuwa]
MQEQSRTNKAARQKQPYNHSSGSKSFLQRQYELAERKGEPIDRVELFQETHVRAGTFVSQAAEDAHNQMLELQSQLTSEGSEPLSEDEMCDQVLGRRPDYSKGLGWGPKPKARRTASASSSSTYCSSSIEKEIELQDGIGNTLFPTQDMPTHILASGKSFLTPCWNGVGKASHDVFLLTFFPTSFYTSGYLFPTIFSFSPTYLCVGSTPSLVV